MKSEMRTINIAIIVAIMQKNNIQHIYIGINTIFVEDGVNPIKNITYVKLYEDKNVGFTCIIYKKIDYVYFGFNKCI
jgi:hypothetical protein